MSWLAAPLLLGGLLMAESAPPPPQAPYLNTWLISAPFATTAVATREALAEADWTPRPGERWSWFDDRLFSRNYDNYQDLFSYLRYHQAQTAAGQAVYAHVYLHVPAGVAAELRLGVDRDVRVWLNQQPVPTGEQKGYLRDSIRVPVTLSAGWNRLMLRISNAAAGRLGFYARVCGADGVVVPGLTASPLGPLAKLQVATQGMGDVSLQPLPTAWREWPYVAADAVRDARLEMGAFVRHKPQLAMNASPFQLTAGGGTPPYTWAVAEGKLPDGLTLAPDGTILGTVSAKAELGQRDVTVAVTDGAGATAKAPLWLTVAERPNKWYEDMRLVALIHNPESLLQGADEKTALPEFAKLMRRQGYGLGMMISYNNGEHKYRFPNQFDANAPDLAAKYSAALRAEGMRFGMYMGNLNGDNHGGQQGAMLMVEEAMKRYDPAALWFDWASADPDGYEQLDALYSMIRSLNPDTLIVLNGITTSYHGDWDVVCLEGWGAWGDKMWGLWPFDIDWPKKPVLESWRMLADPGFDFSRGVSPDPREYLRVQLSLILEGYVANIDHSPTIRTAWKKLSDSPVARAHEEMAKWANPPGLPSLTTAYTLVKPAPVSVGRWGYAAQSLDGRTLYLHIMTNARGKTGLPKDGRISLSGVSPKVTAASCLNVGRAVRFFQQKDELTLNLADITPDAVDTIVRVSLAAPLPDRPRPAERVEPVPAGNLATGKPARLLSTDGQRELVPSAFSFARFGVDGLPSTVAQGAYEWAWAFEVDLTRAEPVKRVVVHFPAGGWATEYEVLLSADGTTWRSVAHLKDAVSGRHEHAADGTPARFVRIKAIKPDGPGQPGSQMAISELEVY
ncbi:MAG: discoidin domain-containing protein [Armatimonadetes bacterium]|nr:discoidin domain-containing protein [Armatimonadota bacterium]